MTTTRPSPLVKRSLRNLRFDGDIDLTGGSNGELQDLTSRLVDGMTMGWNSAQNLIAWCFKPRKEQDHDQQHEQYQCRYEHEGPEARGGDQFQVPGSNPVQGWHVLNRKTVV